MKGAMTMTAEKLLKQEEMVLPILKEFPYTRSDDFALYAEVIRAHFPNLIDYSFLYVLLNHRELNVPSYDSITRVRRKLQRKHEDLASERTKAKRAKQEAEYIEYARE